MATSLTPSNDSAILKFTLPSGIREVTNLILSLTNELGEVLTDAEPSYKVGQGNWTNIGKDMSLKVASGNPFFYVRVKVKRQKLENSTIYVTLEPTNNKEWFLEKKFVSKFVFKDNYIPNEFIKPDALLIPEKESLVVDCRFSRPLVTDIRVQIRLLHINTNSKNITGLKASVDNGNNWINLGTNLTINLFKGLSLFKIRIETLDDGLVSAADKRFEITFSETSTPAFTTINSNNKISVSIKDTTKLAHGTLINKYCIGLDQWGTYANGSGGTYAEVIKIDSLDCGYTYPEAGTEIVNFCAGTTNVTHIADGTGGYIKRIEAYDSLLCQNSYSDRPKNTTVTPTKLVGPGKDRTVILNESGHVFTAMNRDQVASQFSTMYGKWYFEIEIYLPQRVHKAISLGFATELVNLNNIVGSSNDGWTYQTVEERKFHNNSKTNYVGRLEVKDRDVISVLLDNETTTFSLWLNGVNLGPVFSNLSKNRLMFVLGARGDSWAFVNFGQKGFKHTPPAGYYHGFGEVPNPPLPKDTVIRTYCSGTVFITVYADGRGSTYSRETANSPDCGWVHPTPAKGTILNYFCKNLERWKMVADGSGGSYEQFHELNSIDCGYRKPQIKDNYTPTIWNIDIAHPLSTFDVAVTRADFLGKVYTKFATNYGIWYAEFTEWDDNAIIGIYDDNTFTQSPLYTGMYGFIPSTGQLVNSDGSLTNLTEPLQPGTTVGISLDFKNQESVIYIDGQRVGVIKSGLNYPTEGFKSYGYVAATKYFTKRSVVVANFGQLIQKNTPVNHIDGFGPTSVTYPVKGTPLKEYCADWVLMVVLADGNGGTETSVIKTDSSVCGWYPDPPVGTILDVYCDGYTKKQKVAMGNYVVKVETLQVNSRDCGYIPYGELLEWYCRGYSKFGKFANGSGGYYIAIIQYDSVDCGSPIVPAGTVLREFCAGYTLTQHKANGLGGYYRHVVEENSTRCNYKQPDPSKQDVLTPTIWKNPVSGSTVVLSNGRRDASALKRDGVQTEYSTIFGKWYFELEINIPTEVQKAPAMGVSNGNYDIRNWLGSDRNGWSWWPKDGTSYHADTQTFYNRNLRLKDGDIVSVLINLQDASEIEFWVNGVSKGKLYTTLPELTPLFFTFNAHDDSYISANFGQNAFIYTVPDGYYPGFGVLKNPPAARGTLQTTYCVDFEQWGIYADGRFGTYDKKIADNSKSCGWVDPTPPTGELLGYRCIGKDRYKILADGSGGSYDVLVAINSTDCGYVVPAPEPQTSNHFDLVFAGPLTTVEDDDITANITGIITSKDYNYSGLWYYEFIVHDLNLIAGYTESKTNYNDAPGRHVKSWGWAIGRNVFIKNGIETPLETNLDIKVGDKIGVFMDFVNEKLSVLINDLPFIYTFDFPTPAGNYYLAFGNYDSGSQTRVTVYFDSVLITTQVSANYIKGWGTPRSRRSKKYTHYTHTCKGLDRYARLHDGNGGYFDVIHEINSTACGYKPPPAVGTILSYFCKGVDRWRRVADGSGGYTEEFLDYRSTLCGYKPAGTLLSIYCEGFDKYGRYSDGEFGFYNELIQSESRDCGFDDGSGGGTTPGGDVGLDPNLPLTEAGGLIYRDFLLNVDGSLVFKEPIDQEVTREEVGLIRPIQVTYDDNAN